MNPFSDLPFWLAPPIVNPFSDLPFWLAPPIDVPNPHSDVCFFVQGEQAWASRHHPWKMRGWPHCFLSRDGWVEWSISEGAW